MYQQNAQYSEMSQQQTTNAKIQTQGGIGAAVGYDVMDSKFKAAGQMGSIEGTQKAFKDAGKELIEGIRQVTRELTENSKKGEIGTAQGIQYNKSQLGQNFAIATAQSSAENQAFGAIGAISAFGKGQKAIHALARQSKTVSQGDTIGKSAEIGESKLFGGYGAMKATTARMSVGQSFASYQGKRDAGAINANGSYTPEGIEAYSSQEAMSAGAAMVFGANMNDMEKAKELNDALRPQIKSLKKAGLEDEKGKPIIGAKRAAALGRAQGGDLFGIKGGTFEGIDGEQVSLGITQGNDGKVRVAKISSGTLNESNGQNRNMKAEFELLNGEGSSVTKAKEFAEFKKKFQQYDSAVKDAPGMALTTAEHGATAGAGMISEDAAEFVKDHFAEGVGILTTGFLAKKVGGKVFDSFRGNSKPVGNSKDKPQDGSSNYNDTKSVDPVNNHKNSSYNTLHQIFTLQNR